jgi:hypothetical protein
MAIEHPIRDFETFWPFYLGEHRSPVTRGFHYVGTGLFLSNVATALVLLSPAWALYGVLCGYGFAWVSHFGIEKNRPATFRYPAMSLRADFRMLGYFLTGRIGPELLRLYGSRAPGKDAPLLVGG